MRENKHEDVSDGELSECVRAAAVGLCVRVHGGEYLPFSPACVHARNCVYLYIQTVDV